MLPLKLKVYERSGNKLFWSIKDSGEILNKLKARGFNATSLSAYGFSTLYTTLPHNLIKDRLIDLIERTFQREGSPYLTGAQLRHNDFWIFTDPSPTLSYSCDKTFNITSLNGKNVRTLIRSK